MFLNKIFSGKLSAGIASAIFSFQTILISLNAQENTFTKVFYDNSGAAQAYSIIRTSDSHYMIAGYRDNAALLLKMDQQGNTLWAKKYGSAGYDRFNAITETTDSCFVMAGYHKSADHNTQQILCVKVSSLGDTIWSKTIDNGFWCYGLSVQQTNDNGFIVAGYTYQTAGPSTVIIVDKLDSYGDLEWSRTLTCGTHHNSSTVIKQTPDSGYIIGGCYESYSQTDSPALVIKLTPSGEVSWAYKLVGYNYSVISDIVMNTDGILFLVFANNVLFIQTDFSGNILWSKSNTFGGIYGGGEAPTPKLSRTIDNGFAYLDAENLIRTDSAGNFLWSQSLFFYPADVIETGDHGFLAIGNGPVWGVEMTETLNPQIGIIKTDSLGNSIACVGQSSGFSDTITSVFAPVSVTTTNAGTKAALLMMITDAGLSVDSGCVAFTGGIIETYKEKNTILLYPNPSNGKIQVKTETGNEKELKCLTIYNMTGQCIFQSFNPLVLKSAIDLSGEPDGIYFVQVVFEDALCSLSFTISH